MKLRERIVTKDLPEQNQGSSVGLSVTYATR